MRTQNLHCQPGLHIQLDQQRRARRRVECTDTTGTPAPTARSLNLRWKFLGSIGSPCRLDNYKSGLCALGSLASTSIRLRCGPTADERRDAVLARSRVGLRQTMLSVHVGMKSSSASQPVRMSTRSNYDDNQFLG